MAHPVRGASKEMSAGGGCEGEDGGLENGAGAWLRVREGSVQDVVNHQCQAVVAKDNGGWLRGWPRENTLPFVRRGSHFGGIGLR